MFKPFEVNTQDFSNFIYYTMAAKGYFTEIVEELPEKLSAHNAELFVHFNFSEIRRNGAITTCNAIVSLFMKSSKMGLEKSELEEKFNELLFDAYNGIKPEGGFETFGLHRSSLPRMQITEEGYTTISQPIVVRKRNI